MIDFNKLQYGNYICGVAEATECNPEVTISKEVAGQIAGAFCYLLAKKVNKNPVMLKICVGQDPRMSGNELKEGILEAIGLWGAEGYDAGIATTPAMFMSTVLPQFEFDGAIMITAGDLPYEMNGFRFFTANGGFENDEIKEMLRLASRYNFIGGVYEENKTGLMPFYAAYLRQMISQGLKDIRGYLKGMHIVVDARNGSSGFFAKDVLERMGADVSGSLRLEPDGSSLDHLTKLDDPNAMAEVCSAVKENNADLGILFGIDGNMIAAVAPGGRLIAHNEMIALAAAIAADDYPGGTVVTDGLTSDHLHDFLENKLGLKHFRYKSGSDEVVSKARELSTDGQNAFLAAQTSGNTAYSDNYYLDDGAFMAVQIAVNAARLKTEGKDIAALIEGLESPARSEELRFRIKAKDYEKYGAGVLEDFGKWAEYSRYLEAVEPNYDGVRVNFDIDGCKGWFLLRMLLREPVMQFNAESDDEGGTEKVLAAVYDFMKDYHEIEMP